MPLLLFLSLSCCSDLFFYETKFSETKTKTIFSKTKTFYLRPNFLKPRHFFRDQFFSKPKLFSDFKLSETYKETLEKLASFETKMSHSCRGASLSMYKSQIPRILTWGRQPVIQSAYSFHFLKAIALILTKVCYSISTKI